jgi:hypothetical protein
MPAADPPRPVAAVTGLAAGLALAVLITRVAWSRVGALLATVTAVALLGGVVLVAGGPRAGEALGAVAEGRISLASPDRTGAL